MENEPQKKPKPFWHLIVIVLALSAVYYVYSSFGPGSGFWIRSHADEYQTLDYASVVLRPEWHDGAKMHLDGVFLRFIGTHPNSKTNQTYMIVGERENTNREWLAFGYLSEEDKSRLVEGMDVSIYGECRGTSVYQTLFEDHEVPAVFFSVLDYGYQFTPSEAQP